MNDSKALLDKAERSFDSAELLLESGSPDFAVSRAYYGCFYIAVALLKSKGLEFARHAQVVGQYGVCFARTNELDRRYHQILIRAFELRHLGDYQTEVPIQTGDVQEIIGVGRRFLTDASRYLDGAPEAAGGGEGGEA